MRFLNKILGINTKSVKILASTTQSVSDGIPLSEKYPGIDNEELYILLENKELDGNELTIEEKKFLEDEGWVQLERIFHREHMYGRSLAVKQLIENSYQILPDEHGNPFKELINLP